MPKHCYSKGRLLIGFLVWCMCSLRVPCQAQDRDAVDEGRQIIRDLYTNLSSSPMSSSASPSATSHVDLIFVLDRSASVTDSGWQSMLRFVQNFLEHFTIDADNTRVAVVSYGTTASVDIDGIRSGDYNKCAFVSRLQRQMSKKVPSGYSSTHDAILRAKDVALGARADAKKAVIVITDGKSNIGPPPLRASIQLRSLVWDASWNTTSEGPQLQVYAFGIKDAYMPEVRSIASPLPNHTFYIPTFQAFAELARSLHDDSQTENWHVLGDPAPCSGMCHEHAYCACGTRSGQYLCICRDGYQGDDQACTACPRGTYKNTISPSRCLQCPTNSTTLAGGATHVNQCVCQPPLYQEAQGQPCQSRSCEGLPEIEYGHKFHVAGQVLDELADTGVACKNLPDSSCHFQCDVGYRLDGHPGLVCHPNGSWIGDVPSCHIVDCGSLDYHQQEPDHGSVEYVNETTTYGAVVRVECHQGWRAFGDPERVCTHYGAWSGTQTWCVENHCPALPLTPGLIIMPASCGQAAQVPGATCQFMCVLGYEMSGPAQVVCTEHGTWDFGSLAVCVDREPPAITCPGDITTPVTTANFAVIHWKSYPPLVTDNSGEFIITGIGVADSDNPLRLTPGFHQIKYIARDKTGNEASCVQGITVVDFTVHLVTCPETDITINMTSHQHEAVWPEVSFADHNNVTVAHKCVPANNTLLPAGIYRVMCVADTNSYQQSHCQFRAILRQPKCDIPPPPLHGSVSCSPTPTSLLTCTPHCHDNFDFHYLPQGAYVCDLDGNWKLRTRGHFWPDCSRKYHTHKAILRGQAKYFYYSGKCDDVKAQIAEKFTEFLENQAWEICGAETCNVKWVDVYCGTESKRRRRSLGADASIPGHHMLQITPITSLVNLPFQSAKEAIGHPGISSEAYAESLSESEDDHSFERSAEFHETADRTARSSGSMKNLTIKSSQQGRDFFHDTIHEALIEEPGQDGVSKDKQEGGADDTIIRELYQIDTGTEPAAQKPERKLQPNQSNREMLLSEQDVTKSDSSEFDARKRSVGGTMTYDLGDPDTSDDYEVANLINVTPPDYQHQIHEPNEVEIEFTLYKEITNQNVDDIQQSELINILMDVYLKLNESLESHNLILDDSNTTSLTGADNGSLTNSSSTLFPYRHVLEFPTLDSCEFGYVTRIGFAMSTQICVACPAGSQYDMTRDQCLTCPVGYYQPEEAQSQCLACPEEMMTQFPGAHNISQCLAMCNPGHFSGTGLAPCQLCPLHWYQPFSSATACLPCPMSRKTLTPGAVHEIDCLDLCGPGTNSDTGLVPCRSCPFGAYQPDYGATECLLCEDGLTTETERASNISQCFAWDACFSQDLVCGNGGQCVVLNNVATCVCASGFSGGSCEINIPDCFVSSCQNNGTCIDGINAYTCTCSPGFTGTTCEVNIDECMSSPCHNGSSCLDLFNGYKCFCPHDHTGVHCESKLILCDGNICLHGTCEKRNGVMTCVCNNGFAGSTCNTSYDLCSSHPCVHADGCTSLPGQYTCLCLPGYTGAQCDTALDLCENSNCSRFSTCITRQSPHLGYLCKCSGGWTGELCDIETTADFDLVFNANGPDGQYVVLPPEFMPGLQNFSVCAWLRPQPLSAFATIVTFTLPVSPLTSQDNDLFVHRGHDEFDTVFTIKHTDKLIVDIFGHSVHTNVTLIFYVWSHLCVTWSSPTSHWQVVVNGSLSAAGTEERIWPSLPSHVHVVLGQNNPYYAEASMLWEVYAGEITHFNIFSYVLSLDDLQLTNRKTCNKTFGDVIGWTDVIPYIKGDLIIREESYCLDINECWFPGQFPCGRNKGCVDLLGGHDCSSCIYGYTGSNCDEPADECEEDVCISGRCVDGPEPYDFYCVCTDGFTGLYCEEMINMCLSNPCQNGGACTPAANTYSCICPMQHMGPLCERPASACLPNPCQHQGVCVEKTGDTFECRCSDNFVGIFCERRKTWCEDHVCYNGGACQNQSISLQNNVIFRSEDDGFCKCQHGWLGKQCEVRVVLSCDLSPCVNGGSCHSVIDNEGGYRCQCLNTPGVYVDENCEYLNPCELSPCANNTLCVMFPNYTHACLCAGGRPCDSSPHAQLPSNISKSNEILSHPTETTIEAVLDEQLTSIWVWTLTGAAAIFFLLVVTFTFCFLLRRKNKRSQGEIVIDGVDVTRGHVTNPAFHSEELQLEESVYAELGDGYTLPQDGSTAEIGSTQGSVKSANFQRTLTRNTSASSSGSFSSLRSSLSKKFSRADDTNKPLLSDDYLEPHVLMVKNYVEFVDRGTTDKSARSGVSNPGFDSGDYVTSDKDKSRDAVSTVDLTGVTSHGADGIRYVNDLHKYFKDDGSADITSDGTPFSCNVNKFSKCDVNQKQLVGTGYVNTKHVDCVCNCGQPNKGFSQRERLEVVYNPGYIPTGRLSVDSLDISSQFLGMNSHTDVDTVQTSVNDLKTRTTQAAELQQESPGDAKTSFLSLGESYIPFADVWNTECDIHIISIPEDNIRLGGQANRTRTSQTAADSQNTPSHIQPLSVSELDSKKPGLLKLRENIPAVQSNLSHNMGHPQPSECHKPSTLFDKKLREELRSNSRQPSRPQGNNNNSRRTPTLSRDDTEMPRDLKTSPLIDQPYPSEIKDDSSCIEFISEYLDLLPSGKLVLSLPEVSTSRHRQTQASAPVPALEATTAKSSLTDNVPGKKVVSSLSPSHITSKTLPHSSVSSWNSVTTPSEALPPKSSSLPSLSDKTKPKPHPELAAQTVDIQNMGEHIVLENFSSKTSTEVLPSNQKPKKKKDKVVLEDFSGKKYVNKRGLTTERAVVQAQHRDINKAAKLENVSLFPKQQCLSNADLDHKSASNPVGDSNSKQPSVTKLPEQHDGSTSDRNNQGRKLPPIPNM